MALPLTEIRRYGRLIATALVLLTLLGLAGYVKYLQNEVAEGKAAKTESAALSEAMQVYIPGTAEVTEQRQEKLNEVEHVRAANPVWADQPLPDDAADILRQPAE